MLDTDWLSGCDHVLSQINTSNVDINEYTSLGPTALGMYMD